MGYYMRFMVCDNTEINLDEIEEQLHTLDAKYSFQRTAFEFEEVADIFYDSIAIGQIEINHDDDEIFEDDVAAFRDMVGEPKTAEESFVLSVLDTARYMIAIEALWEGIEAENTLEKFDPLWVWLFANRHGILQADNEGFYTANGLIVERKFML